MKEVNYLSSSEISKPTFGGRYFFNVRRWFEFQLLRQRLIVWSPKTKSAVTPFAASPHVTVKRRDKRTILAGFNLPISMPQLRCTLSCRLEVIRYHLRMGERYYLSRIEYFLLHSFTELMAAIAAPRVHFASLVFSAFRMAKNQSHNAENCGTKGNGRLVTKQVEYSVVNVKMIYWSCSSTFRALYEQ